MMTRINFANYHVIVTYGKKQLRGERQPRHYMAKKFTGMILHGEKKISERLNKFSERARDTNLKEKLV